MNAVRLVVILIATIVIAHSSALAQSRDTFSTSIPSFQEELAELLTAGKREVLEQLVKDFREEIIDRGVYTEDQWMVIREMAERMRLRKMNADPYFSGYLEVLRLFPTLADPATAFNDWHEVFGRMLQGIEGNRFQPVQRLLTFSPPFLTGQFLRLNELNTSWSVSSGSPRLQLDSSGSAIVVLEEGDLKATRLGDSIQIFGTSGTFQLEEDLWSGTGGQVDWRRYGDPDIACALNGYQIDMVRSFYTADSVTLTHPKYFPDGPISGSFEDKIFSVSEDSTGSYPRFTSFDQQLSIENIGQGVAFQGGFRIQGTTVYGYGSRRDPARIDIFSTDGVRAFSGLSESFAIRQGERIGSRDVEASIYLAQDSISHPSLNLRYDIAQKTFDLRRNPDGNGRNPFLDTYHQVNIDAENIEWTIGTDTLLIGERTIGFSESRGKAEFESLRFFEESDYRRFQNIGAVNPIATFNTAVREMGSSELQDDLLAERLDSRFRAESIQGLLFDMVGRGFVRYDTESGIVSIQDKVFHYADASLDQTDYDVLRITSENSKAANAALSVSTGDLLINSVDRIEFSPAQRVALKPLGRQVILRENRNMGFDGRVFAGLTVFEGKDFHFNYDRFTIRMDSARYFDLFIATGEEDRMGNPVALSIASRIEHVAGSLIIDAPQNKATRSDIPIFPSFHSSAPSFVYYDSPSTMEGCYGRDSFFFQIDPFHFYGLDNYTREDVAFLGSIVSAEIFPDIPETLRLQEDESLGVQTATPDTGLAIYQGKGLYTGAMDLSNQGFLGKGNLNYLGTSIFSDDFIFKPKELLCSAEEFNLDEDRGDPEYPKAYGQDVLINWRPYKDSMYIRSAEFPFDLFAEPGYTLDGTLILTPLALRANGVLEWPLARLTSEVMSTGAYSVQADSALIEIKSLQDPDKVALANNNVRADIDFDEGYGEFEAREGKVVTELPNNQYQTSMNAFDWDIPAEQVIFRTAEDSLSEFLSVDPNRDSLLFQGKTAGYNLRTNELQIGGVPFVISCDALIYPDSGKVVIESGGQMRTLDSARIIASLENKNHVINRATVTIDGRKAYRGSGYYEYNIGDRAQEILFDDIVGQRVGGGARSEKKTETRATGEVTEMDRFYIDHKTEFAGTISLFANSKALLFDGYARLDVPDMPARQWFSLNSPGDKSDLTIEFDQPKTYGGEPVRAGLYLSKETSEVYPRVMMPLFFRKDRPIIDTRGFFKYDQQADQFIFGDSTKVLADGKRGNLMTYRIRDGQMNFEGTMQLGTGMQYVKVTAAGTAETRFRQEAVEPPPADTVGQNASDDIAADSTETLVPMSAFTGLGTEVSMDVMAGLEFYLPENLMTIILTDLNASTFNAATVNHTPLPFYEHALAELLPQDDALYQQVMSDLRLANDLNIPRKSNPFTMLFSKLPLKWNPEYQSWFSSKDLIGVGSLNGVPINRMLRAYVEFKMPSNGDDRMYVYFETPGGYFYFFGYKQGILNTTSNNTTYTDAIMGMKNKDLVVKMEDGGFFEVQAVDQNSARTFVNRVKEGRK